MDILLECEQSRNSIAVLFKIYFLFIYYVDMDKTRPFKIQTKTKPLYA